MTVGSNYSTPSRKVSEADRAGFVARSPEGHAAKSMVIKGREEEWVKIQADTFKNWVNVNLQDTGKKVDDFIEDFCDGTKLVALVETLQKRKLRHNKRPQNQHHELENISVALEAIKEDGIKLVNIGNTDIHNGNLKLILGLIWSLIAHYQLGASNFPPKKLMLAWLKAVLPDCDIRNFTNDWNNGLYLGALIDYCKPGLMPNWQKLNPRNGLDNCKRAMDLAQRHFNIPMVLEPEHLASPHLDELSGMTYLSYFMKEEDSPGYYATLDWVKKQIPNQRINNFRNDWNDGLAASSLVKAKGGPVPGFREMSTRPENWVSNLEVALNGGKKLGVNPILDPRDMANPNVEYLGVMAWAAQFQWINDRTPQSDKIQMNCSTSKMRVGEECFFKLDVLESDVDSRNLSVSVLDPNGSPLPMDFEFSPTSGGRGLFTADDYGMHEVKADNDNEPVRGAPHFVRVIPKAKKDYEGIEPCSVGSTVEVLINPHHAARPELLEVTAYSPTGRPLGCPVSDENGTFFASFQPDEPGEWKIHVTYDNEDIENSPFRCMVFDPRAIRIPDQDDARRAVPGEPFSFTVDASKTGWGEVAIDLVYDNRSIRRDVRIEEIAHRVYRVTFIPYARGKHRCYIYLNGMEVKGSPFSLKIGKDVREARRPAMDIFRTDRKSARYKTLDEQRAERRSYFTEKEIPINAPQAPPRSRQKKMLSVKNFRDENRQQLFKSDHQTEEGFDLLPVKKKIAFDCPDEGANVRDIFVGIQGPDGRKVTTDLKSNPNGMFTCEFTTSVVGEHTIEVVINGQPLSVSPTRFYTYDPSRIQVAEMPTGLIGSPVEFDVDARGAGFGQLELLVNGGRVSSHVGTLDKKLEKFFASFIPHEAGRHRVDIKFNGEKVPHSPWFVDVKDPSKPLLAPSLVSGKANGLTNGYHHENKNGFDEFDYASKALRSSDFNKLSSRLNEEHDFSSTSHLTVSKTRELFSNVQSSHYKSSEPTKPILKQETKPEADLGPARLATSLKDDSKTIKMDPAKEFGEYSSLIAPALLAGKKVPDDSGHSYRSSSKLDEFKDSRDSNFSTSYSSPLRSKSDLDSFSLNKNKESNEISKPWGTSSTLQGSWNTSTATSSLTTSATYQSSSSTSLLKRDRDSKSPLTKKDYSSSLGLKRDSRSPSFKRDSVSPISSSAKRDTRSPSFKRDTSSPSFKRDTVSSSLKKTSPFRHEASSGNEQTSIINSNNTNSVTASTAATSTNSPARPSPKEVSFSPISTTSNVASRSSNTNSVKKHNGQDNSSSAVSTNYTSSSSSSAVASKEGMTSTVMAKQQSYSYSASTISNDAKKPSPGSMSLKGATSPKLNSFRGTADKCKFMGETVRHFKAGKLATFELKAPGHKREDIAVNIISPEKRPHIPHKVVNEGAGVFRIEFTTVEVGSYLVDVTANDLTVPNSPLVAKAYDSGLIKVTDITDGVVGELSTFRVDASKAGEGQLEISINDGDVPNAVQVLGGGKCLVTYTPEQPLTHEIEVTFNGEQVPGSPFLCRVTDGEGGGEFTDNLLTDDVFDRVLVDLDHLGLIPVQVPSVFTIKVTGGDDAELAVSVQGPNEDIPVKVTGNVKNGFNAEFVPTEPGVHTILVEYNGIAVGNTPFFSKAYDSEAVSVTDIPKAAPGKTVTFAVDASQAGEGNLEIEVISDAGSGPSVPTRVTPMGNAVFRVDFVPRSPTHHVVHVTFNDQAVPGSPFVSRLSESSRKQQEQQQLQHSRQQQQVLRHAQQHYYSSTDKYSSNFRNLEQQHYRQSRSDGKMRTFLDERFVFESSEAGTEQDMNIDVVVETTDTFEVMSDHQSDTDEPMNFHYENKITILDKGQVVHTMSKRMTGSTCALEQRSSVDNNNANGDVDMAGHEKVVGHERAIVNEENSFLVNLTRGKANLKVVITTSRENFDEIVPNLIIHEGKGSPEYRVHFKPVSLKPLFIHVLVDGLHVEGSPFQCEVIEALSCSASTTDSCCTCPSTTTSDRSDICDQCKVSKGAIRSEVTMDKGTNTTLTREVQEKATNTSQPTSLEHRNDDHQSSLTQPNPSRSNSENEVSEVSMRVAGKSVDGSGPKKRVHGLSQNVIRLPVHSALSDKTKFDSEIILVVGKPTTIEVDCSGVEPGTLELVVLAKNKSVPVTVEPSADGLLHRVTLLPKEHVPHHLYLFFQGESVPGFDPMTMEVREARIKGSVAANGQKTSTSTTATSPPPTPDEESAESWNMSQSEDEPDDNDDDEKPFKVSLPNESMEFHIPCVTWHDDSQVFLRGSLDDDVESMKRAVVEHVSNDNRDGRGLSKLVLKSPDDPGKYDVLVRQESIVGDWYDELVATLIVMDMAKIALKTFKGTTSTLIIASRDKDIPIVVSLLLCGDKSANEDNWIGIDLAPAIRANICIEAEDETDETASRQKQPKPRVSRSARRLQGQSGLQRFGAGRKSLAPKNLMEDRSPSSRREFRVVRSELSPRLLYGIDLSSSPVETCQHGPHVIVSEYQMELCLSEKCKCRNRIASLVEMCLPQNITSKSQFRLLRKSGGSDAFLIVGDNLSFSENEQKVAFLRGRNDRKVDDFRFQVCHLDANQDSQSTDGQDGNPLQVVLRNEDAEVLANIKQLDIDNAEDVKSCQVRLFEVTFQAMQMKGAKLFKELHFSWKRRGVATLKMDLLELDSVDKFDDNIRRGGQFGVPALICKRFPLIMEARKFQTFTVESVSGEDIFPSGLELHLRRTKDPDKTISLVHSYVRISPSKLDIIIHPEDPGAYLLDIIYERQHIRQSPFALTVVGQEDLEHLVGIHRRKVSLDDPVEYQINLINDQINRIKVFGPGIEDGDLDTFCSVFVCDLRKVSTNGNLVVRVRGPKDSFRAEMCSEPRPREKIIWCRYHPNQAGHFSIEVLWNDHHVPGSPFQVHICQ